MKFWCSPNQRRSQELKWGTPHVQAVLIKSQWIEYTTFNEPDLLLFPDARLVAEVKVNEKFIFKINGVSLYATATY